MAGVATYGYGTPRKPGEGLRIGVTRLWPRGVRKNEAGKRDMFDVWMPLLAPSRALLDRRDAEGGTDWAVFDRRYRAEMQATEARQTISLLAALARSTALSVGCSCHAESENPKAGYCHRFTLAALIADAVKAI